MVESEGKTVTTIDSCRQGVIEGSTTGEPDDTQVGSRDHLVRPVDVAVRGATSDEAVEDTLAHADVYVRGTTSDGSWGCTEAGTDVADKGNT